MEMNKLTGPNFLDWLRKLRIVLKTNKIAYVLDGPLPGSLVSNAYKGVQREYKKHQDDGEMAGCIMLTSMTSDLQKQHGVMDPKGSRSLSYSSVL